jgi:uncharacterized membrane protein
VTRADLFRSFAIQLTKQPAPAEQRIPFLNEAYKAITKVADAVQYSKNAATLMDLLLVAYTVRK